MPDDFHPFPNLAIIADALQNDDTGYRFDDRVSRNEPDDIQVRPGELNPILDRRSERVPDPVQIRTPAVIHYPKALRVLQVLSGSDLNEQLLGFDCRAIQIQNLGANSYLYCPELNMYLTSGLTPLVTINLPSRVQKLSFVWHTAPFNTASPAGVPGQFANVWLYDEWVPPVSGASAAATITTVAGIATSATATQTNVAQNVASVTLLAANAARKGASVFNDTASALNISFAAVASATAFKIQIAAGGYWSMGPDFAAYTGIVTGIWAGAGAGAARVTELT